MSQFTDFTLIDPLQKAVEKLNFKTPTEVQAGVIPLILDHPGDVVALAPTGTGKTAAFGLPLLQNLDLAVNAVQALVITPTRELCNQVAADLSKYAMFLGGVDILPVYGGAGFRSQAQGLKRGPQIVVATPGRLLDHMQRGSIKLASIRTVVLDEADEMLSLGFRDDMERILQATPEERRVWLFSATMPADIRKIIASYLKDTVEFKTERSEHRAASTIEHKYVLVQHKNREKALEGIVAVESDIYGIVFCRTKDQTKEVANAMAAHGFSADALHGDLSQVQREYVMNRFRNRLIKVLVATDVAARGIDVENLTHVIHYELPDEKERYIHRSGRTGRAGKKGVSIAIISPREHGQLHRLEKLIGQKLERIDVPGPEDILKSRLAKFVTEIEKGTQLPSEYNEYANVLVERLSGMPRPDLIRNFLGVYLQTLAGSAGNEENINLDPSVAARQEESFRRGGNKGFSRNRGRDDWKRGPRPKGKPYRGNRKNGRKP